MPVLDQWTPVVDLDAIEQRMRRLFPGLVVTPAVTPVVEVDKTKEQDVSGDDEDELAVEVSE